MDTAQRSPSAAMTALLHLVETLVALMQCGVITPCAVTIGEGDNEVMIRMIDVPAQCQHSEPCHCDRRAKQAERGVRVFGPKKTMKSFVQCLNYLESSFTFQVWPPESDAADGKAIMFIPFPDAA